MDSSFNHLIIFLISKKIETSISGNKIAPIYPYSSNTQFKRKRKQIIPARTDNK